MKRALVAVLALCACSTEPGDLPDGGARDAASVDASRLPVTGDPCTTHADCADPSKCFVCVDNVCDVHACDEEPDAGIADDGGFDAGTVADAGAADAGCGEPNVDEWCGRNQTHPRCGPLTLRDACNVEKTVQCGGCPSGLDCGETGSCY